MSTGKESGALYHLGEEIANAITHGLGLMLAIGGLAVMVTLAALRGSAWHVVGCSIYGATLVLLYLSSTLYHALPGPKTKRIFRIFDHSAIYLLIAGTYTPFILVRLRTPLGITLLSIVWTISIVGIVFKSVRVDGWAIVSTTLYAILGWLAIIAAGPLVHALTWRGMMWLIAGGVSYTAGIVFFAFDRKYFHAVWHVFVLGGSVTHYFAILFFVVLR
jgi:hemolysin III